MKKYISVLALTIILAPSIALASWWNPFTWSFKNFFFKKTAPIENVEKTHEVASINTPPQATTSVSLDTQVPPQVDPSSEIEKLKKELEATTNTNSKTAKKAETATITTATTNNTIQATKICMNGAVVPVNDSCIKVCPNGETVLEKLQCRNTSLWDSCKNIEGVQPAVPFGMQGDGNGNCLVFSTDVCSNIEGTQSYVPSGMARDTDGNCIVPPAPVPEATAAPVSSLTFTVSGVMLNGREVFGAEVEDGGTVFKQYGVPVVLAWTVRAEGADAFFHCSIDEGGSSYGVASQGTRNAVIGNNILKCVGFGFDRTPTGTILKKSVVVKNQ
jgi:hypothetical protein